MEYRSQKAGVSSVEFNLEIVPFSIGPRHDPLTLQTRLFCSRCRGICVFYNALGWYLIVGVVLPRGAFRPY